MAAEAEVKIAIPTLDLNDGRKMPVLGLGCMEFVNDKTAVRDIVYEAIKIGYRHFDTAYKTEGLVGEGIKKAMNEGLVTREEVFVTTKIWMYNLKREDLIAQAHQSHASLDLGYIDLLLIHGPIPFRKTSEEALFPLKEDGSPDIRQDVDVHTESWGAMQDLVKEGITKSIGVSNYSIVQLEKTLAHASIKPAANQVESHPFLQQRELIDFCKSHGIVVTAYSPFGGVLRPLRPGEPENAQDNKAAVKQGLWDNEVIQGIAKKHGKTVSQVLLKFHVARGVSVIPKTIKKERLIENASIFDFELDDEDWKQLHSLDAGRSTMPAHFLQILKKTP